MTTGVTGRARVALPGLTALMLTGLVVLGRSGAGPAGVLEAGDDPGTTLTVPTTPSVTVPEVAEVVDDRTLEDGWYLILVTPILRTEDEPLLQAARALAIEARTVGYLGAKIVLRRGGSSKCTEHGCFDSDGGGGYLVLLKGPYQVPHGESAASEADLEAKLQWHRTTLSLEIEEAASRGLTEMPGIEWLDFPG